MSTSIQDAVVIFQSVHQPIIRAPQSLFKTETISGLGIEPQTLFYQEGNYFDWHQDHSPVLLANGIGRLISATIQLSPPEDYTGGDLLITNIVPRECTQDTDTDAASHLIASREMGSMTFFPANRIHKVNPITTGQRFAMTLFFFANIDS